MHESPICRVSISDKVEEAGFPVLHYEKPVAGNIGCFQSPPQSNRRFIHGLISELEGAPVDPHGITRPYVLMYLERFFGIDVG